MIANTLTIVVVKRIQLYIMLIAVLSLTVGTTILNTEAKADVIRCSTVSACENNETDYLMMVANDLYNSSYIDDLADHRETYNGYNIAIANVENMSGFPFDTTGIRDFIRAVYETQSAQHMSDGRLGFVLLIGDAYEDDNATRMLWDYDAYPSAYEKAADHFYACLTQSGGIFDDLPDVMIGRLSVGNATELANVVNKIIDYETVYASGDWRDDILLFEGQDFTSQFNAIDDYLQAEENKTHFLYNYQPPRADADFMYFYANKDEATASLINQFNNGRFIVNYEASHGSAFGWHTGGMCNTYFDIYDISSLNNGSKLPFILSVCCETGWFDNIDNTIADPHGCFGSNVDCFAEQLQYANNKGAFAVLASSRNDNTGSYGYVDKYVYEAIFDKAGYNYNVDLVGEAILQAKLRWFPHSASI